MMRRTLVLLAASLSTRASALEWTAIQGLRTTRATVIAPKPTAPAVAKGDAHRHGARARHRQGDGEKFWSTKDERQSPFTYQAGVGGVIRGWDMGLLGAGVGVRRHFDYFELLIPRDSAACVRELH